MLDRKSGHVTVFAAELDDEGTKVGEYDDTPEGFGRIAATTAKQIMLQRLRDAEDDVRFGEFLGKEGDLISGVIQQGRNPDDVMVDLGKLEAILPLGERVPGERYQHGERIKSLVISVRKGMRGPQVTLSRSHPNLVRKLFALEVPEIADGTVEIAPIAREAGHRTKIAVQSNLQGVNAKGACIGPMGQRVRNVMAELHGEKIDIVDWADDPAQFVANALSPARVNAVARGRRRGALGAGDRARLPALARDRQGGPERPPRGPPDRLAHRHQVRRGGRGGLTGGSSGRRPRRPGSESTGLAARLVRQWLAQRCLLPARVSRGQSGPASGVGNGPRRASCCGSSPARMRRATRPSYPIRGCRPGRGAHLHPTTACYDLAVRRRAFARALRSGAGLAPDTGGGVHRLARDTDHDAAPTRDWSSSS